MSKIKKILITKKNLIGLKWSGLGDDWYRAGDEKYLYVRVRSNSNKKYYFVKTRDGKRYKEMIGDVISLHRDLAVSKCYELSSQVDLGNYTSRKDISKFTVSYLANSYLDGGIYSSFTKRDYLRFIKLFNEYHFGSIPWVNLDSDHLNNFYNKIHKGKGTTANYCMRFLHAIGNYAMDEHPEIFNRNPIKSIKKKKRIRAITVRDNYLKQSELKPFIDQIHKCKSIIASSYLEFLLLTGLRRTEAINLKWDQIDFHNKHIYFDVSKNGESKLIPLSERTLKLLKNIKNQSIGTEYVFSYIKPNGEVQKYQYPDKVIKLISNRLGIDIRLHDLRRTFATYMDNLGCPLSTIKTLMGQKLKDVTNVHYVRKHQDILIQWLEKYSDYLYAEDKIIKINFNQ